MAITAAGTATVNYAKAFSGDGATKRELLISCNDSDSTHAIQFRVVSAGAAAPTGTGHMLPSPLTAAGSGGTGTHTVTLRTTGDVYVKRAAVADSTYIVTEG